MMTLFEHNTPETTRITRHLAGRMLRAAVWPAGAVAVVAVVVAAVLAGFAGAGSAALGAVLALGVGALNVGVMRGTAHLPPGVALAAAAASYLGKFIVLIVLALPLQGVEALDHRAVGYALLATVVVWTAGEVIGYARTRTPIVVPESAGTSAVNAADTTAADH